MKKMRVFAGPNGSGKSTLTSIIRRKFKMEVYVNADELKEIIIERLRLNFSDFHIAVDEALFLDAIKTPRLMQLIISRIGSLRIMNLCSWTLTL